jgi:hypothetical protein
MLPNLSALAIGDRKADDDNEDDSVGKRTLRSGGGDERISIAGPTFPSRGPRRVLSSATMMSSQPYWRKPSFVAQTGGPVEFNVEDAPPNPSQVIQPEFYWGPVCNPGVTREGRALLPQVHISSNLPSGRTAGEFTMTADHRRNAMEGWYGLCRDALLGPGVQKPTMASAVLPTVSDDPQLSLQIEELIGELSWDEVVGFLTERAGEAHFIEKELKTRASDNARRAEQATIWIAAETFWKRLAGTPADGPLVGWPLVPSLRSPSVLSSTITSCGPPAPPPHVTPSAPLPKLLRTLNSGRDPQRRRCGAPPLTTRWTPTKC